MTAIYLTTTIPYVNARPHLGHALEFVQADVLARYHRQAGAQVRLQTGTDDNALKNVLAAQAAGVSVREFVDGNAAAFADLAGQLTVSVDDVISTSSDPRHRPAVERLWLACEQAGDLYLKQYAGLYCIGCEQFYTEAELTGGRCPEHGTVPQQVTEENWFFRLSSYGDRLRSAITSGRLRIEPAARRNEVLGFIDGGLEDFSVSRSTDRARGWGIPCPRRSRAGHLRMVRRARELPLGAGLRHRRRQPAPVVDGLDSPGALARQGRAAVPRGLLAGHPALRRPAAAHRTARARLRHGRRREDRQVGRERGRRDQSGRATTVPMRSDGGCSARSPGSATPTSPSTG